MADNFTAQEGATGKEVATDERTIGAVTVDVQRVTDTGGTSIAAGLVSVTTTSGSAVAARDTRKRVVLLALAANTGNIDVGPSGVASGSGFPLAPGASVTLHTTAAIHADASTGTQSLAYVEEYD